MINIPAYHLFGLPHVCFGHNENEATVFPGPHQSNQSVPQQPADKPQAQPLPFADGVRAPLPHDAVWVLVAGNRYYVT